MLFVALLKARSGSQEARIARRTAWQLPSIPGLETVAEYWLQTLDPAAIAVFKAENIGQIWALFTGWDDLFDISIYPAISAEDGLELLKQLPRQ